MSKYLNINLKDYQEKNVRKLLGAFDELIGKQETDKVCIFQSPTGSGKTLMTATFIERIIEEMPEESFCFIWVSIGKGNLHVQSKRSLEKYFSGFPRVILAEEEFLGGKSEIDKNNIVVVNWEKLRTRDKNTGEWKNNLMKDGERLSFREVLEKTRESKKIILIIDESHSGSTTERAGEIRKEIGAEVTLEMSATPRLPLNDYDEARGLLKKVLVNPDDVIQEGMIKKEIIINKDIKEIVDDEIDSQTVVMDAAYKQRLALKKSFELEGSNINPLVLIQLPTGDTSKEKIKEIEKYLADKGVTERKNGKGNGKLAIWLSEQKSDTLDQVEEADNQTDFLIFKQAIDTGWDCPRAHILIKFREIKSATFEIQTVGRILRMPEQKHYANESLNRGYIYTNVQSIFVKEEVYNPNIIKSLKGVRKKVYSPLKLPSFYRHRVDYGDVTASFTKTFEKNACTKFKIQENYTFIENFKLIERMGVALDISKSKLNIIADTSIKGDSIDRISGDIEPEDMVSVSLSADDVNNIFLQIIKDNLGPFRNIKRSLSPIRTGIYSWFSKYLGSNQWQDQCFTIQRIFINAGNEKIFKEILIKSIDDYIHTREKELEKRAKEQEKLYDFDIAEESFYNESTDAIPKNNKKYIYDPCYLKKNRLTPEQNFEKFIFNNDTNIKWWWKNGENTQEFFGVRYKDNTSFTHTFYPDYLIMFSNGELGIYEVKDEGDRDGETLTKAKAEFFQKYIKDNQDKKLKGGIVIERNNSWQINESAKYDWDGRKKNQWKDWKKLKF